MTAPIIDLSFPHRWQAEVLPTRPLILPQHHYVYPRNVEEVERGALEVLVQLEANEPTPKNPPKHSSGALQFLATCALGFRDPAVPSGLWSCPRAEELCAVAGGYAYIIDTSAPERFTMLPYRPVLEVRSLPAEGLLLFVGHRNILAWSAEGQTWESEKLSDEGITITGVKDRKLHGLGWNLMTDKETPFALSIGSGKRVSD